MRRSSTLLMAMGLLEQLLQTEKQLRAGRFANEAAVSQGVVLPLLHALGWPVFDTTIVAPEYALEGRRADYALCDRSGQPRAFIEVKRVGMAEGGDRQLFEYAFTRGVPLAVLTDGQEWSFYLPGELGLYEERRVYKLDLLERSQSDVQERLERYLAFERVIDGEALEAARRDYRDISRDRQIETTLPKAWATLIEEQDSILLELLADKVEDLCGFKPDPDACSRFLTTLSRIPSSRAASVPNTSRPPAEKPLGVAGRSVVASATSELPPASNGRFGVTLGSRREDASSAREVMQKVLQHFQGRDPQYLDRLAARKHGRKRRYVAKSRFELYPDRPDLAEMHAVEIAPGWWMGTNYSRRSILEILRLACEVAGVPVSQLQVSLG